LADWVFGDFQSLKPNPDEHRIQPIEASQLGRASDGAQLHLAGRRRGHDGFQHAPRGPRVAGTEPLRQPGFELRMEPWGRG